MKDPTDSSFFRLQIRNEKTNRIFIEALLQKRNFTRSLRI
jgi:hypothetical protein